MLKLSKKGSYAVKAIIYIAKAGEIVKVSKIADDEKISESLLRRLIADLERAGLLKTVKGRNGGVELGKETSKITAYEILSAVGENLSIRDCTGGAECSNTEICTTMKFYSTLQTGFSSLLKMYTLDKIMK